MKISREEFRKIILEETQKFVETKDVKDMYRGAMKKAKKKGKSAHIEVPKNDKGIHTKKFHSCVTKVGAEGKVDNPYAVCMSSIGKKDAVKKPHQKEGVNEEEEPMEKTEVSEFFPITTPTFTEDFKLFKDIVNQGIDSHLEAFVKSEFKEAGDRYLFNFHKSELPILLRRLRELGTEESDYWASDIENYEEDTVDEMLGVSQTVKRGRNAPSPKKVIDEETTTKQYKYFIDLDERGWFNASVRDAEDNTVYNIEIGPNDTDNIFTQGFMKHKEDVDGLEQYMKQLKVIEDDSELVTTMDEMLGVSHTVNRTKNAPSPKEDIEEGCGLSHTVKKGRNSKPQHLLRKQIRKQLKESYNL